MWFLWWRSFSKYFVNHFFFKFRNYCLTLPLQLFSEYQKCASKIVQAIADNNLPLADEIALNYKQNIQTLQDGLSGLQAFDYKQRFNVPNAPDFDYHNYTRICVRNALGAGKKVLMDKLTSIQKYPQLMDPNIKMRYEHSSLSEVRNRKCYLFFNRIKWQISAFNKNETLFSLVAEIQRTSPC